MAPIPWEVHYRNQATSQQDVEYHNRNLETDYIEQSELLASNGA